VLVTLALSFAAQNTVTAMRMNAAPPLPAGQPAGSQPAEPAASRSTVIPSRLAAHDRLHTRRHERIQALAAPAQIAGLVTAVFTVGYLAFSVPAPIAGVAATTFGLHVIALSTPGRLPPWSRWQPASCYSATPITPASLPSQVPRADKEDEEGPHSSREAALMTLIADTYSSSGR
jgi:hypothetical protein